MAGPRSAARPARLDPHPDPGLDPAGVGHPDVLGLEGIHAPVVAGSHPGHDDAHAFVPARVLGVVDGIETDPIARAHLDSPVGRGDGHRQVPRDRSAGVVVVGAGVEDPALLRGGARPAHERDLVGEAAGMHMAPHPDQGARELGRNREVVAHPVARLGVAEGIEPGTGLAGIDADPLARGGIDVSVAALDVEHRVVGVVGVAHVDPQRQHALDPLRLGRGLGDEVDVVGDVDGGVLARQVVEHVVEQPHVGGVHEQPVAVGRLVGRLLLPHAIERQVVAVLGDRGPDRVVQVELVDGRNRPIRTHHVGLDPHHVAVVVGLGDLLAQELVVGARRDAHRPVGEVQAGAVLIGRIGALVARDHRRP